VYDNFDNDPSELKMSVCPKGMWSVDVNGLCVLCPKSVSSLSQTLRVQRVLIDLQ